ncbi:MAG: winged helix-turn-helix domain-containing protein [Woeseiaceae bacterium]
MAVWHSDFTLDGWNVSPKLSQISKDGQSVGVKHKSMAVLVFLADADGEVVTRNEIMDGVWPGMDVTDDVLTQAIHELRHAFGDDAKNPRIIETIPRVGIRLIAGSSTTVIGQPSRRYLLAVFAAIVIGSILWTVVDKRSADRDPVITVHDSVSIAVLPFVNRSNIAEDSLFVDGMHDDLLVMLSRLSSVDKVIARSSTEQYRDTTKPIPQIGQELQVVSIVEGTVRRSGGQIRINVELIDTETEKILWADTFDSTPNVENLFAIQGEITRAIVAALHGVLSAQEDEALKVMPTDSLEAYAEYVLGRHEMAKRTGEAVTRATVHFENAIELDPEYELAYVSLADSYMLTHEYQGTQTTLEDIAGPAQAAIDAALSINPSSGEAYTSLAALRQYQSKEEESDRHYRTAIKYNPNYATAYQWYWSLLLHTGRREEALTAITRAAELDPLSTVVTEDLARMYSGLGRSDEAKSTLLDGLERNPDYPGYYNAFSYILAGEGRLGEAIRWAQAASTLNPTNLWDRFAVCNMYVDLGDSESALECYAGFETRYPEAILTFIAPLHCSNSRFQDGLELLRGWQQAAQGSGETWGARRRLSWDFVLCGDSSSARIVLDEIRPELFGEEEIVVSPDDIAAVHATVAAGYLLYRDGELDRADYLFDSALDAMQSMRRTPFGGYGAIDVFVHVTRGEEELAVQVLRDAIDSGWITGWWALRTSHYESMQDNPEWLELLAEKEEDIRQQRQWYEEHKDEPLF